MCRPVAWPAAGWMSTTQLSPMAPSSPLAYTWVVTAPPASQCRVATTWFGSPGVDADAIMPGTPVDSGRLWRTAWTTGAGLTEFEL